jgi:hypothetical protein
MSPKNIEKYLENYTKYANILGIQLKHSCNIDQIFQYTEIDAKRAIITSDTVAKMAAIYMLLQHQKSKC